MLSLSIGRALISVHAALITLHATTGLVALAAGSLSVRRPAYVRVYLWSLVACIVLLAAAVAIDWNELDDGSRALFAAFGALGAYMIWRAARASAHLPSTVHERPAYLDRIGFTLVALVDAFLVILVLDLGAPIWLVVTAGVLGAAAGHRTITMLKRRARPETARQS